MFFLSRRDYIARHDRAAYENDIRNTGIPSSVVRKREIKYRIGTLIAIVLKSVNTGS